MNATATVTHTPAPWVDGPTPDGGIGHGYARTVRVFPSGAQWSTPIADVAESAEAEANARLIAAAPDLLSALTAFVGMYPDSTRLMCGPSVLDKIARAEAAIAKAEGGDR